MFCWNRTTWKDFRIQLVECSLTKSQLWAALSTCWLAWLLVMAQDGGITCFVDFHSALACDQIATWSIWGSNSKQWRSRSVLLRDMLLCHLVPPLLNFPFSSRRSGLSRLALFLRYRSTSTESGVSSSGQKSSWSSSSTVSTGRGQLQYIR